MHAFHLLYGRFQVWLNIFSYRRYIYISWCSIRAQYELNTSSIRTLYELNTSSIRAQYKLNTSSIRAQYELNTSSIRAQYELNARIFSYRCRSLQRYMNIISMIAECEHLAIAEYIQLPLNRFQLSLIHFSYRSTEKSKWLLITNKNEDRWTSEFQLAGVELPRYFDVVDLGITCKFNWISRTTSPL